ncbi:MAG TPA: aminotransferase class I/II-fold pyridoxal phosphate-dependent enzyme [Gaiellaceae bacterium]|nr:aminotransferase class I/II-fold pyridoxal phosphate-dependent enzyme [Gaiellaceae bacterium]
MARRSYGNAELESLRRWLDDNQDSRSERLIPELEALIAEDYPAKRVIAASSAMGALSIALQTAGVQMGDEVIVDPIVVFAGMAAMYHNGVPVFADVDSRTFNIDPESVRARITDRTKAIVATHHFGSACEIETLRAIADEHGLALVEDCAHALFATRSGQPVGLFGHFAAFSFNHRKQLSTGQGGFLLINDEQYAELSMDKGFGRVPARLNWNYQMAGVVAALALAQWPRARGYTRQDTELAGLYSRAVEGCEWLSPQFVPPANESTWHIWAAVFTGDAFGVEYSEFMDRLRANGGDYFLPSFMPYGAFGLKPSPVYRYPLFNERRTPAHRIYDQGLCPTAEWLVPRMFNTVISPLEEDRVERYADALRLTISQFA